MVGSLYRCSPAALDGEVDGCKANKRDGRLDRALDLTHDALAVTDREAGNPVGNPVVVTVPAGMQPGGR
jgi:hypothetical protein